MVTEQERIKLQNIKNIVLDKFEFTQEMVEKKTQKHEVVFVRQVCFYMMCHYKSIVVTFQEIGNFIGGKDYSTVYHSRKTIRDLYDTDEDVRDIVDGLHDRIDSSELLRGDEIQEYSDLHKEICTRIIDENEKHKENINKEIERHKNLVNKLLNKML